MEAPFPLYRSPNPKENSVNDLTDFEVWRPLKDYEDLYLVNPYGYVKSLERTITLKNGTTRHYPSKTLKPKGDSAYHTLTRLGVPTKISGFSVVWDTFGHAPIDPRGGERWKPIRGFCDVYEVSTAFRVRLTVDRKFMRDCKVVEETAGPLLIVDGAVTLDDGLEWRVVPVLDLYEREFVGGSVKTWDGDGDHFWRAVPDFPGYEMNASLGVRRVGVVNGVRVHREVTVSGYYAYFTRDGKQHHRSVVKIWERLFADIIREQEGRESVR